MAPTLPSDDMPAQESRFKEEFKKQERQEPVTEVRVEPVAAPVTAEPPPAVEPVTVGEVSTVTILPPVEPPPASVPEASPTLAAMPSHAAPTIKSWFSDIFANLVATGRVREHEAEAFLQDLLKRLGL
jgi:hypothetical protein